MSNVPVQVIVAAFNDPHGASAALQRLRDAKRERLIVIEDAAVLTKDASGRLKINETADMGAGKGAAIGAIVGGVAGLLAGPVGWVALGGSIVGGLAASVRDGGIPDARLRALGEGLTPNSSALIAIIDHIWVAEVERDLAAQGAQIVTEALRDDIAAQLRASGQVAYTAVSTGDAVYAARMTAPHDSVAGSSVAVTAQGSDGVDAPATAAEGGSTVRQAEDRPSTGD